MSLTESLLNESLVGDVPLVDGVTLSDSVFDDKSDMSYNMEISTFDITDSVSEQVREVDDDGETDVDEALSKAYNTSNKRFERAIGNKVINNDVIKLNPV